MKFGRVNPVKAQGLFSIRRIFGDLDFSLIDAKDFDFINMLDQLCKRFLLLNINHYSC